MNDLKKSNLLKDDPDWFKSARSMMSWLALLAELEKALYNQSIIAKDI